MKRFITMITSAVILTCAFSLPANAYTTVKPAEYDHGEEESVKNDKLYIYGYSVEDTKIFLWEDQILFAEEWYGVDENGAVYIKDEEDFDAINDDYLHDYEVEVYTIKDGKKEKINDYDAQFESERSHWNKGLKPYTTYKFQLKISYLVGDFTDEEGNTKPVYKEVWSDPLKIRTCPKKTVITYTKAARHTVRIRWKAVKCEGYKLQQYNSKKKKWVSIRTLPKSKTSAKIEGLKANSKYKFRVVPYGRVADKRYPREVNINKQGVVYTTSLFGKASKIVTVKTKK